MGLSNLFAGGHFGLATDREASVEAEPLPTITWRSAPRALPTKPARRSSAVFAAARQIGMPP
jgi:hypothetical protein